MSGKRNRRVSPAACAPASAGRSSRRAAIQIDLRTESPFQDKVFPGAFTRSSARGFLAAGQDHPLRGIGEADPLLLEGPQEAEVDRLLAIQEDVLIGRQDPVDRLEIEPGGAEALEVGALEAGVVLPLDELA